MAVAPADARIFSAQAFAFATANEQDAIALLSRTNADGGGHSSYNLGLAAGPRFRTWLQAGANGLRASGSRVPLPFESNSYAIEGGADATLGSAGRLGVAIGYDRQTLDDASGGSGRSDNLRVSLYASQSLGPIGLSAVGSYAHAWIDTDRATGIGAAHTKRAATQWLGGAQAAVPFQLAGATITPIAGVIVSRLQIDGFAEHSGAPAAFLVSGGKSARTFVTPFAQIGWSYTVERADGTQIVPDVQFGYRRSQSARGMPVTLVAQDGTAFAGNRIDLPQGSAFLGASLTAHKGHWTGFVSYRGQFGSSWQDNGGTIGVRLAF
jgi:uncharacterized protein with beta-barrel porin domain